MEVAFVSLGDNLADPTTGEQTTDAAKHKRLIGQAVAAEAAGFNVFQLGEHHFNDYVVSQPAVALAAVAQHTTRIKLGTGVTLLPTLDPVLVAEEFATLDALSDGRAEIAVARGIDTAVFDAMGRAPEDVDKILPEAIELLHRLLTEENVSWNGEWRAPLDNITIRPRPVQHPLPVWTGTSSTIELSARLGLPTIWVAVQAYEHLIPAAEQYFQAWVDNGRDLDDAQLGIAVHFHIAETSQKAKERFAPHRSQYGTWIQHIKRPRYMDNSMTSAFKKPDLPADITPEEIQDMIVGPFCGSPQEMIDKIGKAREALGFTRIALMIDMGGTPQDMVLEQIELAGAEVLPALHSGFRDLHPHHPAPELASNPQR